MYLATFFNVLFHVLEFVFPDQLSRLRRLLPETAVGHFYSPFVPQVVVAVVVVVVVMLRMSCCGAGLLRGRGGGLLRVHLGLPERGGDQGPGEDQD